ncbi:expressed unknown protein [Seminavis robusta]|uniref:Uncharacterized protein n=1 Tax=Seminavis robusta TaxID=568900 RepID=A0A9N8EMG5_9STRA|nr:expressed unknown protein [Seminavis robusta]|eukprot:Sro1471_g275450.1 n/a (181) ;mRNA; f:24181-24723
MYYNDFDVKCQELDEIGHPLADTLKKTLFLQGILDREYNAVIDHCQKESYATTIDLLRAKARSLGRAADRARRVSNYQSNYKARRGPKQDENDEDIYDNPSTFPDHVWEQMTEANQTWIMDHQDKDKEQPKDYGKQYSGKKGEPNQYKAAIPETDMKQLKEQLKQELKMNSMPLPKRIKR